MVLALLLARRGVRVHVLEMHADFERDFRGDTIHPSTMEMLDRIAWPRTCTRSATASCARCASSRRSARGGSSSSTG